VEAAEPVEPEVVEEEVARGIASIDRLPEDHAHGGQAREAGSIDMVVIHTIGGQYCADGELERSPAGKDAVYWRDWFETQGGKSIHYIVGREGDIAQQRPELRTAGHVAFNGVKENVNARSIGIELVNRGDGEDPFPEAQLVALEELVSDIAIRHELAAADVYTHAELDTRMLDAPCDAHRRNVDPGPLFPMARLKKSVVVAATRAAVLR
ncbi:MAG: N-acetylmuramoyl-L-alanine amidase, partial [Myxococcota bacterium]